MQTPFQEARAVFVASDTNVLDLARTVSAELVDKKANALRMHSRLDDASALNVLAKVLATAPHVRGHARMVCTPNLLRGRLSGEERLYVYTRYEKIQRPLKSKSSALATFTAVPPGREAQPDYTLRFTVAVHDRLRLGDSVEMQCRGPDAV